MSQPVIEVKGLSKVYRIGHERQGMKGTATLRDSLSELAHKPIELVTGRRLKKEEFWALKDINFTVNQGDVMGIVGKNGSGKSTMLKILSRIVDPTEGEVRMHGKVASLLEVGTGFHPELTGRENVFFNGAILGMKRKEIIAKFDEIVAFSEVEQFLDTPVKFYSSGMYVRLAFAVAAHLDPDILIVDEVLAVGDAAFQKKCLKKMKSVANSGRTVLYVSHNTFSVKQLCNKAMYLEKGNLEFAGDTESVISHYLNKESSVKPESTYKDNPAKSAQFTHFRVANHQGETTGELELDEPWTLHLEYKARKICPDTLIGVEILDEEGQVIFMTANSDYNEKLGPLEQGTYSATIPFKDVSFVPGTYYIRIAIQSPSKVVHDQHENIVLRIRQNPTDVRSTYFRGKYMGYLSNKVNWIVEKS